MSKAHSNTSTTAEFQRKRRTNKARLRNKSLADPNGRRGIVLIPVPAHLWISERPQPTLELVVIAEENNHELVAYVLEAKAVR